MSDMTVNTNTEAALEQDESVPVVDTRKAGALTWGEESPKGGRTVMHRALREDATVPLFLAQTFIQSLRDVGYDSTISALCEHVDNSIGAGAKNIRAYIRQTGRQPQQRIDIAVQDDGSGMTPQVLKVATSFGGSTNYNNRSGIGRFGMGMKTAGLSMAPAMEIVSWQEKGVYNRMTLDTEAIGRDRSNLVILAEPELLEDIGADLAGLLQRHIVHCPATPSIQRSVSPADSEQKIPLRHGQHLSRRAGQQHAVRHHRVGLRVDLEVRGGAVVDHAGLAQAAPRVLHGHQRFGHP
jgi:hypothetical protein